MARDVTEERTLIAARWINELRDAGRKLDEIAKGCGVSASTISKVGASTSGAIKQNAPSDLLRAIGEYAGKSPREIQEAIGNDDALDDGTPDPPDLAAAILKAKVSAPAISQARAWLRHGSHPTSMAGWVEYLQALEMVNRLARSRSELEMRAVTPDRKAAMEDGDEEETSSWTKIPVASPSTKLLAVADGGAQPRKRNR
jgi:hypothetical protein